MSETHIINPRRYDKLFLPRLFETKKQGRVLPPDTIFHSNKVKYNYNQASADWSREMRGRPPSSLHRQHGGQHDSLHRQRQTFCKGFHRGSAESRTSDGIQCGPSQYRPVGLVRGGSSTSNLIEPFRTTSLQI